MLNCTCPASSALTTITAVQCSESFGQIQKIAFQRLYKTDGTKNAFTTTASITLKASWTALLTATDSTKIVVSPYVQAPTSEAGDPITFGGGNETLGGIEIIVGRNPSKFSAVLRGIPQDVVALMKKLECEAQAGNLGVYLFDDNGNIEALQDATTNTTYYPIPIASLFIGDKAHGGLEALDSNTIQWSFPPNYSDTLKIVTPSFNPTTEL